MEGQRCFSVKGKPIIDIRFQREGEVDNRYEISAGLWRIKMRLLEVGNRYEIPEE